MSSSLISIVIPVYNEEACLRQHLSTLQYWQQLGIEVIVVDGGSSDSSVELAVSSQLTVLHSPRGRAKQMNFAARHCRGEVLVFLHIDSVLPKRFEAYLSIIHKVPWGFFRLTLSNSTWVYRIISFGINARSRFFKVATGDQAIFVRADVFKAAGGFRDIVLMEDIDLTRRLKQRYAPFIIGDKVVSSSRRWESRGVIKTTCLMWFLQLAFKLGVSPERIARWYR